MPINPEIPLQGQAPAPPNSLQDYANAMSIQNQKKQGQAIDLENQQRKLQMEAVKQYNLAMQAGIQPTTPPGAPAPPATGTVPPPPTAPAQPGSATEAIQKGFYGPSGDFVANPAATQSPMAPPPSMSPASWTTPAPSPTPASSPNALTAPLSSSVFSSTLPPQTSGIQPIPNDTGIPEPPVPVPNATSGIGPGDVAPMSNALAGSPTAALNLRTQSTGTPQSAPLAAPSGTASNTLNIPTMDYDKVVQFLVAHNQGSQVMGVLNAQAKYRQEVALQHKNEAEVHQAQMAQIAQLFQGVNAAPSDQKEAVYQQALQVAAPLAQKYGVPISYFPAYYDPQTTPTFLDQTIAHATTLADFAKQTHEAADLQQRFSAGLPKTANELEDQYRSDISLANSQADLDLKNQKWQAIARTDPTGNTTRILSALAQPTWSPGLSTDSTLESLKPEDRVKYFTGQLNDASQRLKSAALRGPQAYAATLGQITGKSPELANIFPAAPDPNNPTAWDGQKVATQAAMAGATGEQYITAQNSMQYKEQLLQIRDRLADVAESGAAMRQQALNAKLNGPRMTPGQQAVEERNISSLEDGTPTRPGLNLSRLRIGQQITQVQNDMQAGKTTDAKGNALVDVRNKLITDLQGANDALQKVQFRKAKLYGIGTPDPQDVASAADGEAVQAADGSTWKKQDGVAFFKGMGDNGQAAAPAPIAGTGGGVSVPPTGQQKPAQSTQQPIQRPVKRQQTAAPKFTEAQIRQGAVSRGLALNGPEANAAVQAARAKGLLQ